jgi:hypothetical protein
MRAIKLIKSLTTRFVRPYLSVLRHVPGHHNLNTTSAIDEVDSFNLPNPSSRTMALRSTQPLTEISTRNLLGSKERSARKVDNRTAIYESNV